MHRPTPRFTVMTLGVADMRASIAFYVALGFDRRMKETGEQVAFFDTGGTVLALYTQDDLAMESGFAPEAAPNFRGVTLAWNCTSEAEVDSVMAFAAECGARIVKTAEKTAYGGYAGYFADPDEHVWEAVVAPGIEVGDDHRVHLPG